MLKEFKEFINRGNVIDLAVAFVLGVAFADVVKSLVKDVVMPPIGFILGKVDFSNLVLTIGKVEIRYGLFINSLITFLIVSFVVFLIVKAVNRLKVPIAVTTKDCPFCCTAIPIAATRCSACTSELG
jgi:large conductance mechanosensitive channel